MQEFLEFADGTQLEIFRIFRYEQIINKSMRTALDIHIRPETLGFDDLKTLFRDEQKISRLYNHYRDENGEMAKNDLGSRFEYKSILNQDEEFHLDSDPMKPIVSQEFNIVTITQRTDTENALADTRKTLSELHNAVVSKNDRQIAMAVEFIQNTEMLGLL